MEVNGRVELTPVLILTRTEEESAAVSAMLKRVSSAMSAVLTFSDKMADLDEDSPHLTSEVPSLVERLILTLMSIYPNQNQMAVDIKSIGDFSTKYMDELKKRMGVEQ